MASKEELERIIQEAVNRGDPFPPLRMTMVSGTKIVIGPTQTEDLSVFSIQSEADDVHIAVELTWGDLYMLTVMLKAALPSGYEPS